MPAIQRCVKASLTKPIILGRQGENNATQISFDISEWRSRFGTDGEIYLYHQRPKDKFPYRVPIEVGENEVLWNVSDIDTDQYARYGQAELRYVFDNKVIKSEVYRTSVYRSLAGFIEQYPTITEPDDFTAKSEMFVTYVSRLPERGQANRLYVVPSNFLNTGESNKYDTYIWIEWENRYEQFNGVIVKSDYDVLTAKMNAITYAYSHTVMREYFLIPDTTEIAHIKCLDETYWGEDILLTFISAHYVSEEPTDNTSENESASQSIERTETSYRVSINENGWLELKNSNAPITLDAINLTFIFAEAVESIREEQELAHNPIPLRLDYENKNWIDTIEIERQSYFEFLSLAGIEKTFILLDQKPEHVDDLDELYERLHSDDSDIYELIGADENGYYYRRIYFENGIIPQDKDVYTAVYTRTQ